MDFHWLSPRSNKVLVPVTALVLLALAFVEQGRRVVPSPWADEMLRAAEISYEAASALKQHRLERGVFVDPINDPAETALIGQETTQITTDRGYLEAKLASTDPNLAAVVVDMLRQVGVEPGDCVAVAMTGSFPALNLSTLAAVEAVGARAVPISSVGASNFGATDPYFTWLDMERAVVEQGILSSRSVAASLGGSNDTGRGLSPRGRQLLSSAIERNGVPLLAEPQLEDSIIERVQIYRQGCAPSPVAAYVNVGGGVASLGHSLNAELIPVGASPRLPQRNYPARGALVRLAMDGVPVIQLLQVRQIRRQYGLVTAPDVVPLPGAGEVYGQERYSVVRTGAATSVLLVLLVGLHAWDRHIHRLGRPDPEETKNAP